MMFDVLVGSLLRFETHEGLEYGSLPEVFAALMADRIKCFPALRAHQEPAWHMFLAQLGAIAAFRAGLSAPPDDAATWRDIIGRLTHAEFPNDEPWCLVVNDWSKPAFLQPPVPDGVRLEKRAATPDALDMLITSRNHDLKQSVAAVAGLDDWIFALVSLQTMEGFCGRGNYGVARMNGGSSSRVLMGLAPLATAGNVLLRPGPRLKRDIGQLLVRRDEQLQSTPVRYSSGNGLALTWMAPWLDGAQLAVDELDILFVEVCRRVRLGVEQGVVAAAVGNSSAERIKGKEFKGVLGDPWAPVHRTEAKALTIGDEGEFHYARVVELLFSGDWQSPLLAELGAQEADEVANWLLVLAAIARGNSKTGGFKSRTLPLKGRQARGLAAKRKELHLLATEQIQEIKKLDTVLRNALALAVAGGDQEKIKKDSYERTNTYRDRLDAVADRAFFPALWARFEAEQQGTPDDVEVARREFLLPLIDSARHLLAEGIADIPCPSILRARAEARARRRFEASLRGDKTGFRSLFVKPQDDELETIDA